ncbi:metallophosphoesterase family protein [Candidatus Leptofilum sp.]|uniref:metallophosphoesterase family protein n=1 Tax=Candidatus Leptofilum sp. TaxID=3241576 RepID=UPI003B5AB9A5
MMRINRRYLLSGLVLGTAVTILILFINWRLPNKVYHIDSVEAGSIACTGTTSFAVIGDYGDTGQAEADVANLVHSWNVDYVLTTGDNNYPDGEASTIDENIGQYYQQYIGNYSGSYGPGSVENRFYPSPGNHDWNTGTLQPYLDYFTLPGNERYYDVQLGPVHLFALDSDPKEPDGRTATSTQATWLQTQLIASTAPWKLIILHHPPYSSSSVHGSTADLQWPFADWGATAVLAGHDHTYERIHQDGILYFVNGLGGRSIYSLGNPIEGSAVRYNLDYGAMRLEASPTCLSFSFYSRTGSLIDSITLYKSDHFSNQIFLPLTTK